MPTITRVWLRLRRAWLRGRSSSLQSMVTEHEIARIQASDELLHVKQRIRLITHQLEKLE